MLQTATSLYHCFIVRHTSLWHIGLGTLGFGHIGLSD